MAHVSGTSWNWTVPVSWLIVACTTHANKHHVGWVPCEETVTGLTRGRWQGAPWKDELNGGGERGGALSRTFATVHRLMTVLNRLTKISPSWIMPTNAASASAAEPRATCFAMSYTSGAILSIVVNGRTRYTNIGSDVSRAVCLVAWAGARCAVFSS